MPHNDGMTERQCGDCTACCEGWLSAKSLDMKPGRPCAHCTASGCAIYESRPQDPCIDFVCGWLQEGSPLPEDMRPDRSGVIVLFGRRWHDWDVITAVPAGERIPPDSLRWLTDHARQARTPLIFSEYLFDGGRVSGQKNTGFGPPAFREAVELAIGPQDVFRLRDRPEPGA